MAGSLSDILAGLQNGVQAINGLTTKFNDMFGSSLGSSAAIGGIDTILSSMNGILSSMSGQLSAMGVTLSSMSATQASMSTTLSSMSASVGTIAGLSQLKLPYGQFTARISSNSTGIPGAYNKLNFNTEVLDSDSIYTTSDYRYTPTRAGWYYIYVGVYSDSVTQTPEALIYKDGSPVWAGTFAYSAGSNGGSACAGIVQLNGSSNYVEGYSWLPADGTIFFSSHSGGYTTYMCGWRVA